MLDAGSPTTTPGSVQLSRLLAQLEASPAPDHQRLTELIADHVFSTDQLAPLRSAVPLVSTNQAERLRGMLRARQSGTLIARRIGQIERWAECAAVE